MNYTIKYTIRNIIDKDYRQKYKESIDKLNERLAQHIQEKPVYVVKTIEEAVYKFLA